tara:strand:- start:1141 stop:1860 length:720 start_codon:yes stop_codon:yes gene_type:complete
VRHSVIAKLISFLLICPLSINSASSQSLDNKLLSNQLEEILNAQNYDLLRDLFLENSFKKFNKQYLYFTKKYQDTQWSIKTIRKHTNRTFLDIKITSTREIGDQVYNLNSKQIVKLKLFENKIQSYEVLNEESILKSPMSPLVVEVISPNKVLTGEKYEVNLIIKEPLDNSLIASGMIVLDSNEKMYISDEQFGIKPNQSGGLFKYIQAPLRPGFQTISAIITHPEGIYSITKKIKVDL